MTTFKREKGFSELELFHAAIDHLGSAKVLFERDPRTFDSAGYLSHLGIELLLKALILNMDDKFDSEHSLKRLWSTYEEHHGPVALGNENRGALELLEDFYELRYPKVSSPIEIGSNDWDGIERLFEFLVFLFPEHIQEQFKNLDYSEKGNRILMYKKVDT